MLTDGRMDRQKVITIAHPEQSSGELKIDILLSKKSLKNTNTIIKCGKRHPVKFLSVSLFCTGSKMK